MSPRHRLIEQYREQLLRWNPQINLVSRKDTVQRVDALLAQAEAGIQHVVQHLPLETEDPLLKDALLNYFDLGSGGGIPGVVWHIVLSEKGYRPETCLVEPREKRTWFLERQRQLPEMPPFCTLCDRWGEDTGGEESPCAALAAERLSPVTDRARPLVTLISLKALRLTDLQILAGMARMAPHAIGRTGMILIARYYPPGQTLDPELREQLRLVDEGAVVERGTLTAEAAGAWVENLEGLAGPGASLVFSRFRVRGSDAGSGE